MVHSPLPQCCVLRDISTASRVLFSAGAPSHDAVRLGGLSLSQRVPNSCSTTTGSVCVFPFTYGGGEYNQCSYADSPVPWCATATQADGKYLPPPSSPPSCDDCEQAV